MKYPLSHMKCIQLILLVQCTPPAFNKTIKWDYHQQVAKKLLAVAAVIHEAIHLQNNPIEMLYLGMKQVTIPMDKPLEPGTRCHSLKKSSRKRQQLVTTKANALLVKLQQLQCIAQPNTTLA